MLAAIGHSRILFTGARKGENAELAIFELVDGGAKGKRLDGKTRRRARHRRN